MMKSIVCVLSLVINGALILFPSCLFGADKPEIKIILEFPQKVYPYGKEVNATVTIEYDFSKDLLINSGTSKTDVFVEMRLIDPAGKIVIARRHKPHKEFPDAPPLPFIFYKDKPARDIPCEVFKPNKNWIKLSKDEDSNKWLIKHEDIRDYYALERLGEYNAQIQISVATFSGRPCNNHNSKWVGILDSNIAKFTIAPADDKQQSAELYPPLQKLSEYRNVATVEQSRQVTSYSIETKSDKSTYSREINTRKVLYPQSLLQNRLSVNVGDRLDTEVSANLIAYNQSGLKVSDINPGFLLNSSPSAPLTASNHKSFAIELVRSTSPSIPGAYMAVPAPTLDVPVDTAIEVDLSSADSGFVVMMNVMGTEVYNTQNPAAYPHTQHIDTGSSAFTLIYQDPQTDFANCQQVDVVVKAYKKKKPNKIYTYNFNFETICLSANDMDGDGIPNDTESTLLFTNKEVKTLFIRPKMIQGSQFVYWPGFISLFPDPRAGFASVPAFEEAKIEISVIGAPGHPYAPMRSFDYDPSADSNHPACDILEIIHMPIDIYCTFGHHNFGHTYFYSPKSTWYWDTKGYVPNDQTTAHYQKYGYFTPLVYPFALDNYFKEGAYNRIEVGQRPMVTIGCGLNQCYDFVYSSPLNLNASNPVHGRPDGTVEFNAIIFDSTSKQISNPIVYSDTVYDRETVARRTIVHEIGHALLAASEGDHCSDLECIMYHSVADWRPWDFGPPSNIPNPRKCTHSLGGSKDIRAAGVVHNRIH